MNGDNIREAEIIRAALKRFYMTQYEFCAETHYPLPVLKRIMKHGFDGIPDILMDRLFEALEMLMLERADFEDGETADAVSDDSSQQ